MNLDKEFYENFIDYLYYLSHHGNITYNESQQFKLNILYNYL